MVCRLAKTPSRDVRNQLNLSADSKVLVLAFGGHTNAKPLELKDGFLPENWICLAFGVSEDEVRGTSKFRALPFDVYMPDFIAMADVVMGKIGYGTVTECLAHGTPLIYIPRSHWPEEQYVEEYLLSYQAGVKLSAEDFYAGRWKEAVLTAAQKAETCWNVASLNAGSAIQIVGDEIVDYTVEYGRC